MKTRSIVSLLLSIIIIAGTVTLAVIGINGNGAAKDITLGLDLKGGVSITYEIIRDPEVEMTNDEYNQAVNDTLFKLQKRVDSYGYTEAEIYKEGNNRINVDIPGADDANEVLKAMGQAGKIEFIDPEGNVVISGSDVKAAQGVQNTQSLSSSPFYVVLKLNAEGSKKFAEATTRLVGQPISIVFNDEELMNPTVNQPITGGEAQISGFNTIEEASEMASIIRIGALPLELKELRANVVGAKLGQDAINTSVKAGLIGIALIIVFMIGMYRLPGLSAAIALLFYASLTLVLISITGITLTLPGIAGIILSVGMAVDANVIIFSRIKEELALGKTLNVSIKSGFKKATSAIVDGNVTTIIAGVVLWLMGTGTIKGFATTLILGILISMFTALFVTRIILVSVSELGFKNKALYGIAHEPSRIDVIHRMKLWIGISVAVIVIGIVAMPINLGAIGSALNYDVEFAGGTSTLVTRNAGESYASQEELELDLLALVTEATGDATPQFKNVKNTGQFIVTTKELDLEQRNVLAKALVEKFGITEKSIESESISPTISSEMQRSAIIAIVIAAICMLIYITFRFSDYRFGVSAVIALVHDILIVLAVYAILREPINNSFIAVMLTIVGYSINDTIVLFDRVRENQVHMKRNDFVGVVNLSINQTITRSINTSLTTFIMVLILFILGVASIREFALPLMVGILSGTYSSIFIASPIWYMFKVNEAKKA